MSWSDVGKDDPTVQEVYDEYLAHPRKPQNPLTPLTIKERAHILSEIKGVPVKKLGFKRDAKIFERPKVVNAIEDILDKSGLTDDKLAKRLKDIIFKGKGANADNTAHNAIRTVWQLKQRFAPEKHEVLTKGELSTLSDEQLDKIIEMGIKQVRITQVKVDEYNISS